MKNLHKIILGVVMLFFCVSVAHAQKFTVSNVIIYDESPSYVQNKKNKALGTQVELTFFDEDVKVTIFDQDDGDPESEIFTKIDNNTYKLTYYSSEYCILYITRILGYIKSASLKYYTDDKLKTIVSLKRN